jgi:hypothetical protein
MPVFKTKLSEDQRWELVLLIRSFAATGLPTAKTGVAPAETPADKH